MIEVTIVLLSLGLSIVAGPRDKIWTPTFKGPYEKRYALAVEHYQKKMGLTDGYVIEVAAQRRVVNGEAVCAWVERSKTWREDTIAVAVEKPCRKRWKPELLALHEQCHRRWAHLDMPEILNKHDEVESCMFAYSAKERR